MIVDPLWSLLALAIGIVLVAFRIYRGSQAMDCKTCQFNKDGGCRRFPPHRVYTGAKTEDNPLAVDVTVFPVVMNADGWWCGEYKERR